MFKRPHHRRIARVLNALNAERLREHQCYFGGGTAIALRYGEYRESVDIDFLISDKASYKALRETIKAADSIAPLFLPNTNAFITPQNLRVDQYGIRCKLVVDDQPIKFEIIAEGRIEFEQPAKTDVVEGVTTLSPIDLASSKLLANSDRWSDQGVFSRDIIDLAMTELKPAQMRQTLNKAEGAYGKAVLNDFNKAHQNLTTNHEWLERCIQKMDIETPKAVLWQRLKKLHRALNS